MLSLSAAATIFSISDSRFVSIILRQTVIIRKFSVDLGMKIHDTYHKKITTLEKSNERKMYGVKQPDLCILDCFLFIH